MQVLINDLPIEFQLEKEKGISEVVDTISEWTRQRNLVFYELYVNDDLYPVDNVPDIEIDEVKVLNCIVHSKADIVFTSVDQCMGYCGRVVEFIDAIPEGDGVDPGVVADIIAGTEWLVEVILKVIGLLGIDPAKVKYRDAGLSEYIEALQGFKDEVRGVDDIREVAAILGSRRENFAELKDIFRTLVFSDEMKNLIIQSIDSPDVLITSLELTADELPGELKNIEDTAIAYQTGRDAEGSERIGRFVDFLYRYIRTCLQVVPVFGVDLSAVEVDGVSLEDKNRQINDMLNELITIMENNDIISLSDILEYEIKPTLVNLGQYIEVIVRTITDSN